MDFRSPSRTDQTLSHWSGLAFILPAIPFALVAARHSAATGTLVIIAILAIMQVLVHLGSFST